MPRKYKTLRGDGFQSDPVTIVSFKSKYIAVAVVAAVVVSLAVGSVMVYENRRAARCAARFGRRRFPQARARASSRCAPNDIARHVAERVE